MTKARNILLLLLALGANLHAQTMCDVVKQMPDTLSPLLTRGNLLDFPDYIASQMRAELTNRLGGTSEMLQLTDDYTLIQLSKASTLQLKLLPQGKRKFICLIRTYTVNDSISDSQLQFYTTDWKPLKASKFISIDRTPDAFVQATVSATDTNLTLRRRYPLNISFQDDVSKPKTETQLTLKWNGKKFTP